MDYFTKWIEAETLTTITERQMEFFLWKFIVCRFDMPHLIIMDNGTQFQEKFKSFCTNLNIALAQSSVMTPQTNKQVEAMNNKILTSLKKKVGEANGT